MTLCPVSFLFLSLLLNLTLLTFHTLQSLFIGQLSLIHTNVLPFPYPTPNSVPLFGFRNPSINECPVYTLLLFLSYRNLFADSLVNYQLSHLYFSSPLLCSISFFHSNIPKTSCWPFLHFFFLIRQKILLFVPFGFRVLRPLRKNKKNKPMFNSKPLQF